MDELRGARDPRTQPLLTGIPEAIVVQVETAVVELKDASS